MAKRNLKGAVITVKDGGGKSAVLKVYDGNVEWTEGVDHEYVLNNGVLDSVEEGDEQPVEVTFDFGWETATTTGDRPEDIFLGRNGAVTAGADACEPYACTVEVVKEITCGSTTITETIPFPELRVDRHTFNYKDGKCSFPAKCKVTEITPVVV